MDLISALTSQLGIDTDKAQGLAGAALGTLQEQVSQKLGGPDAAAFAGQIPELAQWKDRAAALTGGGGAGGLLGAASSLLGGAGAGGVSRRSRCGGQSLNACREGARCREREGEGTP